MRNMTRPWTHSRVGRRFIGLAFVATLLAVLAGCSLGGSSTPSGSDQLALTQVPWCDVPAINFVDSGSTAQTTFTNWDDVRTQLGFTTYLPANLPKGSCLVLAGGSVHDPIFGGHFVATWNLPGNISLSFSEAPKRANLGDKLQCAQSAQDAKTAICLGVMGNTGITIASPQSASAVQAIFQSLKPDVNWVPANTNKLLATQTPSS